MLDASEVAKRLLSFSSTAGVEAEDAGVSPDKLLYRPSSASTFGDSAGEAWLRFLL